MCAVNKNRKEQVLGGLAKHSLGHRRQGPPEEVQEDNSVIKKKEFKNPFIRTGVGLALSERRGKNEAIP